MTATLVSFLGVGQKKDPKSNTSEYEKTIYEFIKPDGTAFRYRTALFGAAMLAYLTEIGECPDRWIVLGTSWSIWQELLQAVGDQSDVAAEDYCTMDERVRKGTVDEQSLAHWQEVLNSCLKGFEIRLRLIGEAIDPKSQDQIIAALFDEVPYGSDVVFDITHGFRHQSVIAAFAISLMRWTHRLGKIRFYYGMFEARRINRTPAVELPVCQRLVDAAEAAAVLDATGNYEPVARFLGCEASLAWFYENTNQIGEACKAARLIKRAIGEKKGGVSGTMAKLLEDPLAWAESKVFFQRCFDSARKALERNDYFRAVVLVYEAFLISAGQILYPSRDPLDYETRQESEKQLFQRLRTKHRQCFESLKNLRNACVHGTRCRTARVQKAAQNPEEFRALLMKAFKIFENLAELLAVDHSTHD